MEIIKRNGSKVPFDFAKIERVVTAAFAGCGIGGTPTTILGQIKDEIYAHGDDYTFTVEEVQDIVETQLMERGYFTVAHHFMIYRYQHAETRLLKERIDYMDEYSHTMANAATASETDGNANVTMKNVANLNGEVYKTTNRRIQRYRMTKRLQKDSPEVAEMYEKDIEGHTIYVHDEASYPTVMPYCMAVTLFPFMQHGTAPLDGLDSKAPNSLSSFAGQFCNLVFLLSAQVKGAVAYGEVMNCLTFYAKKSLGDDFYNHMDEFVFLGPKMRHLLRESGEWIPSINEFRNHDFGRNDLNKMRDEITKDTLREATEDELRRWAMDRASDLKLGDGTRTVGAYLDQIFQQIIWSINQPAGNRCYQSPFTNFSYYDEGYWHALFDEFTFPDGSKLEWKAVDFMQRHFMKWFNRERTKALLTFPVETMALLHNGKDCKDRAYKDFTAEMYAEGHSFFTYLSDNPNALASCCRLRNGITDNTFSFTNGLTGVQTGSVNVITLNIARITQNWARLNGYSRDFISRRFFSHQASYKRYLSDILERVYKYHIAYKSMVYENEKAGMYSSCNAGYISISKLYSTIGVNGINEAAEFLGMECTYNENYKNFCRLVTGTISENNKSHSTDRFLFNQEFVPAESLSAKNYKWDKEDGYWVPNDRNLYNSYFYKADDPGTSVLDKFRLHGREFTELLDGGVGLHCNLEEHLSKEQYLKLMDFAIANGTTYFTYNIPNSICTNKDCRHIIKLPVDKCPKCGAPMDQATRVIGYLKRIRNFEKPRQIEATKRHYAKKDDVDKE